MGMEGIMEKSGASGEVLTVLITYGYGFSPVWTLKMSKVGSSSITLTTFMSFIAFPSSTDIFMISNIFVLADTLNPLRPFARPLYYMNSKIVKSFRLPRWR